MNLVRRGNSGFPSIIDEFLKPEWFKGFQGFGTDFPAVNIKETKEDFSLEMAAPGKSKEDFNIEVNDNVLTVSSEQKQQNEEKDADGRYTRREFSYSSFKRSFTLPENIQEDNINACYKDGVLHISLPKLAGSEQKTKRLIEVK